MDETRVGVIGGGGFIGTWLVEALRGQDYKVQIIDLESSGRFPDLVVWTDVRDRAALLEACRGCDVVYNLAAEHHDNVRPCERYHQVNVQGALNTCSVAEELGIERMDHLHQQRRRVWHAGGRGERGRAVPALQRVRSHQTRG